MKRRTLSQSTAVLLVYIVSVLLLEIAGFSVPHQYMHRWQRRKSKTVSFLSASYTGSNTSTRLEKGGAPNKRTALKWVVQSIERYDTESSSAERPSPQLLRALNKLQRGKTQRDVAEVGRTLQSLDIAKTESARVQERVIKALSISGLLSLALELMNGFIEKEILPSSIAYVAVANSLRKSGRVQQLEQLLNQLGSIASEEEGIDVMALNIFLAATCHDVSDRARLEHARDWLRPGVSSERLAGTNPDAASYSTVMNAAASMGNGQMLEELWEEMTITRKIQPNIYVYNSLLRCASGNHTKVLDVLDRLLTEVQPDRYTIDLVLMPLIKANRIADIDSLLGNFVTSQSVDVKTASKAFAAFMTTLIKAGELATARDIFDKYLLPSLSSFSDEATTIRPTVRHFNLLIDGYKRVADSYTVRHDDDTEFDLSVDSNRMSVNDLEKKARTNGQKLYKTMLNANIKPDAYTLTSLLGIMTTPEEVSVVFRQAVNEYGVEVTPAVLRALITTFGMLGDPASACIAFDEFAQGTMNVRTWNALLSALARGAQQDWSSAICIDPSTLDDSARASVVESGMCKLVNGQSCFDAIQRILFVMESNGDQDVNLSRAPRPNSQTFCIVASGLQAGPSNSDLAMDLFRNATSSSFSADGRLINAIFRCFGDDINGALSCWKSEIRSACLAHENRRRSPPPSNRRKKGKNLIASYHGLLHVCGRALRPDIAVRLVYAMNKEGLEVNEMALNCYRSGKRTRQRLLGLHDGIEEKAGIKFALIKQFESVLLVECTRYDRNDIRRAGEKRVRIII